MIISIAAVAKNGVIGKRGAMLPWRIPEEIKLFKAITTGHVVIMGRKTYESIGKPLPNRVNLVISRTLLSTPEIEVISDLKKAIAKGNALGKDVFIIGGAELFTQALSCVDKMYLSELKNNYEGDVYFPEWDRQNWKVEKREEYADFTFVVYARKEIKA